MDKKTTTLDKQRALAASLGSGKPAKPAKAAGRAAKKATKKRSAKKAKKKVTKRKTKPIGARIKVIKDTSKKAPPKKAATKAKPAKSGQGAGQIKLDPANLNTNEMKVLEALRASRSAMTLVEIAKAAFPRKTRAQGNSWVRNALRRLVRGLLVNKVDRGTYKVAPKGQGEDPVRPQVLAASPPEAEPSASEPAPDVGTPAHATGT